MTTFWTKKTAIALGILSLATARVWTASAPSVAETEQAITQFKTFFEKAVRDQHIVGSSVRVVHDGQVVASDMVGSASLEPGHPVDDATIFHWGSITKTFTGIAILQLKLQTVREMSAS